MKGGPILSGVIGIAIGSVCFAALEMAALPAVVVGLVTFGASNMIFSTGYTGPVSDSQAMVVTSEGKNEDDFSHIMLQANRDSAKIYSMRNRIEDEAVVEKIERVHELVTKIIATIKKSPDKYKKADKFFSYYLPTTITLLSKYDEIENQGVSTEEMAEFMVKTSSMLDKIEIAFQEQLNALFAADMLDANAEMKVFDTMLKSDGISGESDFKL